MENLIKSKKFIIKNNINIQDKEFMIMEFQNQNKILEIFMDGLESIFAN